MKVEIRRWIELQRLQEAKLMRAATMALARGEYEYEVDVTTL